MPFVKIQDVTPFCCPKVRPSASASPSPSPVQDEVWMFPLKLDESDPLAKKIASESRALIEMALRKINEQQVSMETKQAEGLLVAALKSRKIIVAAQPGELQKADLPPEVQAKLSNETLKEINSAIQAGMEKSAKGQKH